MLLFSTCPVFLQKSAAVHPLLARTLESAPSWSKSSSNCSLPLINELPLTPIYAIHINGNGGKSHLEAATISAVTPVTECL